MSAQFRGAEVDLSAVTGGARGDGGVANGGRLLAFVDAAMRGDDGALGRARRELLAALPPEAFVDTCAVIGAFNAVDRVADATGIPLDDALVGGSADVRAALGLSRFASAANTPAA